MFGLLHRRSRHSLASSVASKRSADSLSSKSDMDAIQARQTSSASPLKAPEKVDVAVNEVPSSASDRSGSQGEESLVLEKSRAMKSSMQVKTVIDITRKTVEKVVCEIDDVDDSYFHHFSINSYFDLIHHERLFHMPRKGSQWDLVLKAAEYFGVQMIRFANSVGDFVTESESAARSALANCQLLLELGHNQASALEPTFNVLSEFGQLLSRAVGSKEFGHASQSINEDIADVYSGLVGLIGDIAIFYRQKINSMETSSVTIDFEGTFGNAISHIWAKKEHLFNHMWRFCLREKSYSMSVESIRSKLSPVDQSVKLLLRSRLVDKKERAEGTCEWMQYHLLDFVRSNEKVFTITGAAGCGKSMLADWMKERLERPLGRKNYETLSYTFARDAPAEATPIAFLKSVLSQLFERNVGDIQLFEKLVSAFESCSRSKDTKTLESSLWQALKAGLQTVEKHGANMVMILDGLDEVSGAHHAADFHKTLHDFIEQHSTIRAVILSRPVSNLGGSQCKRLVLTPEDNRDDILIFLRTYLKDNSLHFEKQNQSARDKLVESLTEKAKGSFLWAYLSTRLLVKETSYDNLCKASEHLHTDASDLIRKFKIDLENTTTRDLLSFMLAAKRPFTIDEMTDLLNVNVRNRNTTGLKKLDLQKHISNTCGVLVVERNGLIRFKHSTIRKFMYDLCGKSLMSLKDANRDLTLRMLLYAKFCLNESFEPSLNGAGWTMITETFRSYSFMEYTARNWIAHFRHSSLCDDDHGLALPSEFKELIPTSAYFCMMEWSCWQDQVVVSEAIKYHELSLRIRTACFGEKHQSVMQALIIVGSYHHSLTKSVEAAGFFYRASCIGQVILSKFSSVVTACTSFFLTITESMTFTKRTEIVTYREEMIRVIIEIHKCKRGPTSDIVIRWYEVLAKLYIDIKEEHRASVVYKELYEIIVIRFGKNSEKARGVSKELGGLSVVLKKGESEHDVVTYDEFILETSEDMEAHDELRISIVIRLAQRYESVGKWVLAERLYINLWRRISEICRIKASLEIQLAQITIALEYVRFLHRLERIQEASSILMCLWAEYEFAEFESETIIIRLKEIGTLFRSFGCLSVAVSIFNKVWGWFKSKGKTTHKEAVSTTILITEVVEEITETTTTTTTATSTTTTVSETVVREIFETHYSRCRHSKVEQSFFKACIALIKLYMSQQNWVEAEVVIKKSLEITWKAILTMETKLTLTETFVSETIIVATQLALCYHRQRYFEKAEQIYLRIYQACLVSLHITDIRVTECSRRLIEFYEEYHRHEKTIEVHIELLGYYRKHLGVSHQLTIRTLYAIGSLYMRLGRSEAYQYYIEIVKVLSKDGCCHHDAFEAATIVCRYYHEQRRCSELQKLCVTLWQTFIHHHHEHAFTEEMVQIIYEKYTYVLEFHAKVEFSVLYKLSVEYRETVVKVFGVSAAIVLKAMIALAEICEKHESHYHESIAIYEEVIKKITTTTTTTTTTVDTVSKTVKKRLSKMYVTIITSGSSTKTTTIERAISICLEVYEHFKIEYGCWHEMALTKLKEICVMYKKLSNHQTTIIRLLQTAILEVLSVTTTSLTLYSAAITLASIYVSVEMVQHGQDLLHQLRHLIILGSSEEVTLKLDFKLTKIAFVFLTAFEQRLIQKTVYTFSEIMADMLLETCLYEQYTEVVDSETSVEIILEYGAKLRFFWEARERTGNVQVIDKRLFQIFKNKYGSCIKTHDEYTFVFYVALLAELSKDRAKVDFAAITCMVSNHKVKALLDAGDFQRAQEVARCAFQFISAQRFYHHRHCISYGYKLAEFLAGIDVRRPSDNKTRESMMELSRVILRDVLSAFREANIDIVGLKFEDVAGLVKLLGYQQYYSELEYVLERLWQSREVQKTWSTTTILSIGRSLIHAHYANGHHVAALDLCSTMCYNLRRSYGWLDEDAVDMSELLARLYTSLGRHREAMNVHEEILREIDESDDRTYVKRADKNLEMMRRTFQRNGGWSKGERGYRELYSRLTRFGCNVQPVDQWSVGKGADAFGTYSIPTEWMLEREEDVKNAKPKKRQSGVRTASGLWLGARNPQSWISAEA